jgi:hypothetical protein
VTQLLTGKVAVNYLRDHAAAAGMVATVTERLGPPDTLVLHADAGGFRPTPVMGPAYETRLLDEMRAAFTPVKAALPCLIW